MKFSHLCSLLIIFNSCSATDSAAYIVHEQTNQVCRRRYFVERLTKPLKLLATLYQKNPSIFFPIPVTSDWCTDPVVRGCIEQLHGQDSLAPLFELWNSICCYKYLSASLISKDFSFLVCTVFRQCCDRLLQVHIHEEICDQLAIEHDQLVTWDPIQVLDLISHYTVHLKHKKNVRCHGGTIENSRVGKFEDICSKDITLRYCLTSRLKKTFDGLTPFKHKTLSGLKNMLKEHAQSIIIDNYVLISHPRIMSCCKEMERTESILPFLLLWKQFKCFEDIHDLEFLKEFLKIIVVIYHFLLLETFLKKPMASSHLLFELDTLSAHLNEYSMLQLLKLLDQIELSYGLLEKNREIVI